MGAKGRHRKQRSNEHLQKAHAKREARERDRVNEHYKSLYVKRAEKDDKQ